MSSVERWPELRYENWRDTCQTLHRWTQIIGKIRLSESPWVNHAWHSSLYVTERGLSTSLIHGKDVSLSIEMDFVYHVLTLRLSDGRSAKLPLTSESVAEFHDRCFGTLRGMGVEPRIFGRPNELEDALPFAEDYVHSTYDPVYGRRFWQVLLRADRLMKRFRSRFVGKASPVHFFWGSFDLAVSRFSGRRAPEHPGGVPHLPDLLAREAYSHEVSSCGFWPGNDRFREAAFYSYAYPMPEGFAQASMPEGAYYHEALREFILPYEVVRAASDPDALVLEFFERTYAAAADLGHWDRAALEESPYLKKVSDPFWLRRAS